MAGRDHQRILALVTRRMQQMGFQVIAREGPVDELASTAFDLPQRVGRHRPDAIGVGPDSQLCIGEAKTSGDMQAARTREQLEDYLCAGEHDYPLVVLGFPRSCAGEVHRLLRSIGAIDCPQLTLLPVPDELLNA